MADRVDQAESWILHTRPYRETSLLVDAFSREHGRLSLVARGGRRPLSSLRARLLAFQPLALSWFGKGAVRTLHAAEWQGGLRDLAGGTLICGFYLNELLLRLLPAEDAHATLFDAYGATLHALAAGEPAERCLRRFELVLLEEMGYAEPLHQTAAGVPIEAERRYFWRPETGLVESAGEADGGPYTGAMLQALAAGDWSQPEVLQGSKFLMRALIGHHLGAGQLHTRQLLIDLNTL
jgi:DNA repair protein RecO (recombination protein O)